MVRYSGFQKCWNWEMLSSLRRQQTLSPCLQPCLKRICHGSQTILMCIPDSHAQNVTGGGMETDEIATSLVANAQHMPRPSGISKGPVFPRLYLAVEIKECMHFAALLVQLDDRSIDLRGISD